MTDPELNSNNSKVGNRNVFSDEQKEKISTLEKLINARKNLSEDIDRFDIANPNEDDEDNDGLKDYRGIF